MAMNNTGLRISQSNKVAIHKLNIKCMNTYNMLNKTLNQVLLKELEQPDTLFYNPSKEAPSSQESAIQLLAALHIALSRLSKDKQLTYEDRSSIISFLESKNSKSKHGSPHSNLYQEICDKIGYSAPSNVLDYLIMISNELSHMAVEELLTCMENKLSEIHEFLLFTVCDISYQQQRELFGTDTTSIEQNKNTPIDESKNRQPFRKISHEKPLGIVELTELSIDLPKNKLPMHNADVRLKDKNHSDLPKDDKDDKDDKDEFKNEQLPKGRGSQLAHPLNFMSQMVTENLTGYDIQKLGRVNKAWNAITKIHYNQYIQKIRHINSGLNSITHKDIVDIKYYFKLSPKDLSEISADDMKDILEALFYAKKQNQLAVMLAYVQHEIFLNPLKLYYIYAMQDIVYLMRNGEELLHFNKKLSFADARKQIESNHEKSPFSIGLIHKGYPSENIMNSLTIMQKLAFREIILDGSLINANSELSYEDVSKLLKTKWYSIDYENLHANCSIDLSNNNRSAFKAANAKLHRRYQPLDLSIYRNPYNIEDMLAFFILCGLLKVMSINDLIKTNEQLNPYHHRYLCMLAHNKMHTADYRDVEIDINKICEIRLDSPEVLDAMLMGANYNSQDIGYYYMQYIPENTDFGVKIRQD